MANDLISRQALLSEYDRVHIGPPGGARKLMEDAPAVQQWIPLTERLPEPGDRVIACGAKGGVFMVRATSIEGFGKVDGASNHRYYTHWMHLPDPPEGERKDDEASQD